MITKLLNEVNEKIETLNNLVQDKEYFEKLDERIEKVNNYAQEQKQERDRLHSIIKEVREYIKTNCLISDTWEELENHQFIPIGRINFKSLSGKKIKKLLEILDKESD